MTGGVQERGGGEGKAEGVKGGREEKKEKEEEEEGES